MSTRLEPINAIAYAQFHLRGGLKGLLLMMLGTVLLVGLMAVPFFVAEPDRTRQAAEGATMLLLGIQWLVLTLFGASRVTAAVRGDLTSGLIESHRLTPASPLMAVLGYVLASPVQAIAVAAVILPCGVVTTFMAGLPIAFWLVGNVMAIGAAVLLWSLAAVATFSTRQASVVTIVTVIAGAMSAVLVIVPGIMVIASPVAGQTLWFIRRGGTIAPAFGFTLVADVLLAGVFVLAAARRYRSVVTDAFNVPLGMLLLTIWAAITLVGLAQPTMFWNTPSMGRIADGPTQLLAGLGSLMLVAILPVAALARAAVAPPEPPEPGRRRLPRSLAWLGLPVCIAFAWSAAGVAFTDEVTYLVEREWATAVIVAVTLTSAALWFAASDLHGRTGWVAVILWLVLTNVAPLLTAAILHASDAYNTPLPRHITSLSPMASLALLWANNVAMPPFTDITRGLLVQTATLLVPLAFFLLRVRQGRPDARRSTIDNTASAAAE